MFRRCALAAVVTAATTLAGALAASVSAAPADSAPTIRLAPGSLPRGPNPAIPYVRGSTIVDGSRRIVLDADTAFLLGVSGDDYVVWASRDGRPARVWRVTTAGTVRVLLRGPEVFNAVLSADGDRIALTRTRVNTHETTVTVHDAVTGDVEETTTFKGFAEVLDLDGDRAVVGTISPDKTLLWHVPSGMREKISDRRGYAADLAADRLAALTGDPFRGGCSVVSTLAEPSEALSQSCTERVYEFAPGGSRMALIDLLTDGLGPSRVTVRTVGGAKVASYDAPYYFGLVTWETSRALLMETNGHKRSALVRCRGADCERASKLGPAPEIRPAVSRFSLGRPGAPSGSSGAGAGAARTRSP